MEFQKIWHRDFNGVYASTPIPYQGVNCPFFATEEHGSAFLLAGSNWEEKEVWSAPGGSMNTVAVPGKDGEFLSIQQFFPIFKSENAVISWGYPNGDGWSVDVKLHVPFVHRIEIICGDVANYLVISQLTSAKDFTDDWSRAGSLMVSEIDFDTRTVGEPVYIMEDMFQNHGLLNCVFHGKKAILTASSVGIWAMYPPTEVGGSWGQEKLLDDQSSDIALLDIDGDGVLEMGVISGFHGDEFTVYKEIEGTFTAIYKLEGDHKFGHAIWGDTFNGVPSFFAGFRAAEMGLYRIRYDHATASYVYDTVALDIGPTNCSVLHKTDCDVLLAANRETNHCAIYKEV